MKNASNTSKNPTLAVGLNLEKEAGITLLIDLTI